MTKHSEEVNVSGKRTSLTRLACAFTIAKAQNQLSFVFAHSCMKTQSIRKDASVVNKKVGQLQLLQLANLQLANFISSTAHPREHACIIIVVRGLLFEGSFRCASFDERVICKDASA